MIMAMESTTKFLAQNIQNPHDFDWPYHEDFFLFDKALELPSLDGFFGFNSFQSPFDFDHFPYSDFQNPEKFGAEMFLPDEDIPPLYEEIMFDEKPQSILSKAYEQDKYKYCGGGVKSEFEEVTRMIERGFASWNGDGEMKRISNGRSKSAVLELDEIQKHFHVPISEAAKELNVGLTVLKKRCRELNIMRWPHRKLKSLKSLINNVKEMGLTNEMVVLEEHKRLLEKLPDMDLSETTKRLRQACFKAKYKKKRSMAALQ